MNQMREQTPKPEKRTADKYGGSNRDSNQKSLPR